MSFEILKKQMSKGGMGSLYLFHGPEKYLMNMYLKRIEKIIVGNGASDFNFSVYGKNKEPGTIIDCCETLPVMCDRRLVIVREYGLFGKKADNSAAVTMLEEYVENVPAQTCLIFIEEEIDKRRKIYKQIDKHGVVVPFEYRKPHELEDWVIKEFGRYGKTIDKRKASKIVENCEASMADINSEIEKLAMYLKDKKDVNDDAIDSLAYKSIKSRIFDLTDAISQKNTARAITVLKDMLILKEPIPLIIFMIARQLRQMLLMKLLTRAGVSVKDASVKAELPPFIGGKVLKQADSFSEGYLEKALEKCLEYDVSIKSGKMKDETAVELLIIELC
jgi:DNA polymerase III subunit delta